MCITVCKTNDVADYSMDVAKSNELWGGVGWGNFMHEILRRKMQNSEGLRLKLLLLVDLIVCLNHPFHSLNFLFCSKNLSFSS